ncbi:cytosine permease [Evansella sp. LMS18]|uniref:cytosine permease n=1 Tax=Evansella sp. LMS18 TaxID=2924033 RepID=UPI0020CFFEA1|nr:cytosine permease [Evansella sp. LMS18]UTR11946.1 cytosine permease [Evansella sp. LMS18]
MNEKLNRPKVNDFEREPVPAEHRKGWLHLTAVWLGIAIALSATVLGGTLGGGLTLPQAVLAAFLGSLVLAIVSAFCCVVGAKTGLSTGLISKFALGRYGSYAVSAIVAIALFGWFGVQLDLFGASFSNVLNNVFGLEVHPTILIIVGGILMTSTAVIGYKAIEKLSKAAVPLMVFLLLASLYRVLSDNNWNINPNNELFGEAIPFGIAVSLVIGSLAIGAVIGPDIARYAKTPKDAVIGSFSGFLIGFSTVLVIAAILAKATSEVDIVSIMLGVGWGTFAMLILILAQWTTNDNNLYSAALGFSVIFKKLPKYQLTIIAGIVGTVMAVAGIYDNFIPFLSFLSALIPPIGGIYVADYLLKKNKYHFNNLDKMRDANPIGLSVWVIASLFAFMTTPAPNGFGIFSFTNAPGLDAFIVAFGLQIILVKAFDKSTYESHDTDTKQAI